MTHSKSTTKLRKSKTHQFEINDKKYADVLSRCSNGILVIALALFNSVFVPFHVLQNSTLVSVRIASSPPSSATASRHNGWLSCSVVEKSYCRETLNSTILDQLSTLRPHRSATVVPLLKNRTYTFPTRTVSVLTQCKTHNFICRLSCLFLNYSCPLLLHYHLV